MSNKFLFLILIGLLLNIGSTYAQYDNSLIKSKHRTGFIIGSGNQDGLNVEYNYQVQFFQLQYYWVFFRGANWSLELISQPQYNLTQYRPKDNIVDCKEGYEVGLNIGTLLRGYLYKDILNLYIFISAGPHYVSGTPERQSNGFIFSDNFFIGLNIKTYRNIYLDFRSGFRHISNDGLNQPNGGLNDIVISGGILLNL